MIQVRQLYKRFGMVQALDGADFTIADGRIVGLLGPNGAGKTTALRIVFGLLKRDAGEVLVDGIDPAIDAPAVRRRLGILSDQVGLYDRLTTHEHLEYFGRLHGMENGSISQRIAEVSALLGMDDILQRRTMGFSQGQRLKVSLARALLHQPKNLLLDEPTRGLDVMSIRSLRSALRALREQGCCIVLATHVMQEVSHLCDEVVVMARGKTLIQGSPAALIEHTGMTQLEDAFVSMIGTDEGIAS